MTHSTAEPESEDVRVALQAFIYRDDQWLFLRPNNSSGWRTIAGRLMRNEDVDSGLLREVREELGSGVEIVIERTIDTHTFDFPSGERYLSVFKLARYHAGTIVLGSDVSGWEHAWLKTEQLLHAPESGPGSIAVPYQRWIVRWACDLRDLLRAAGQ